MYQVSKIGALKMVPQGPQRGASGAVPDRDDHLHPGRDRAGMTLNPAGTGTGMTSKTRPGPGSESSRPGYRDSNRDLTHFLML